MATLREIHSKINSMMQHIIDRLGHHRATPMIKSDEIQELIELKLKAEKLIGLQVPEALKGISTTPQYEQEGTALNSLLEEANNLFGSLYKLEARIKQNLITDSAKEIVKIDKTALESARDYHRQLAQYLLYTLLFVSGIGVLIVSSIFGMCSAMPIAIPDTSNLHGETLIFETILFTGGRISLILLIGWAIRFIGNLHSHHAAQSVIYQDRLSGLMAASILLDQCGPDERNQMLSQMTDTYLGLKHNAFIEQKKIDSKENQKAVRLALKILSEVKPIIQK